MRKVALITGIAGQSGSYLAEKLIKMKYNVVGILKKYTNTNNINHIKSKLTLEYCNITDQRSIIDIVYKYSPDEIYNLAAESNKDLSFSCPYHTINVNCVGLLNLLESIKITDSTIRLYNAGSSDQFGNNFDSDGYQREITKFNPVTPYGITKVFCHNLIKTYREQYGFYLVNGIHMNFISPRKNERCIIQKIINSAIDIKSGKSNVLVVDNTNTYRDWSHAKDHVDAMHLSLNYNFGTDYIISSGINHGVLIIINYIFNKFGLDWNKYLINENINNKIKINKGDSSKIKRMLGWSPKCKFETIIDDMINSKLKNRRYDAL